MHSIYRKKRLVGHYDLYEEMSDKFFNFVRRYFSLYEKASIDECFIDATKELSKVDDVVSYLREFQETLTKETGLTVSIGVSPTRFLSKMASDMEKPNGLVILRRRDFKDSSNRHRDGRKRIYLW